MDDVVNAPLIGSCQVSDTETEEDKSSLSKSSEARIIKPKRRIVVEPVLIFLAISGFTMEMTVSLFTYRRFQEQAADELGINVSALDLSQLMKQCDLNKSSEVYQLSHLAQTKNSYFNIVTGIAVAIPNLVTAIFLGPYSDKAGRKYAIVIPLIGSLVYGVVCLLVAKLKLPLWILIIGKFAEGVGGTYIVILVGCFAYIADTTSKDDRQFRITIVELTMFLSGVLGPVGVGYWIQKVDYFWPITAATCCIAVNLLYAVFLIPETIIKDPQAKFFTVGHLKDIIAVYSDEGTPGRKWQLMTLYLAFVPIIMASLGNNISTLFTQNPPLCWDAVKIGNFTAISMSIAIVGSVIFAKAAKFCMKNYSIALISALSSVVKNVYNGFVNSDLMMYCLPALMLVGYLFIPTIRAMMSNLVHPTEQGAVFASIALSEVVFSLVGNLIFSAVYANTIAIMSGFVYFVLAGSYAIGAVVLVVYIIRLKKENMVFFDVTEDSEKT